VNLLSFTKAKRAQNVNDYETWISGGVAPTLNAMDNNGEAYATVLIIDGTRVDDVRVYEDGIVPTVISRYGTGGGNVPMIFENEKVAFDAYNHTVSDVNQTLRAGSSLEKIGTIVTPSVVRRLTPVECERLQGFPDDWTSGQADSNRYKQMGNAVAVPVVEWIISRMVAE
jgi:site-specific DNA-cytosine methylase